MGVPKQIEFVWYFGSKGKKEETEQKTPPAPPFKILNSVKKFFSLAWVRNPLKKVAPVM